MSTSPQEAAEAYAFRQLVAHMQMRTDVQNIELMILSGFCRNCLSKWYHAGLARAGVSSPYEDACQRVYGMSVADWKKSYQSKASEEQLRRMEETKALHAKHEKVDAHAAAARPPAPSEPPPPAPPPADSRARPGGLLSDVCCEPVDQPAPNQACARPPTGAAGLVHRLPPPPSQTVAVRLAVLTVSDRASRGEYEDLSGPEIEACMREFASTEGGACWRLSVVDRAVVPDEGDMISSKLVEWSDADGGGGGGGGSGGGGGGGGGGSAPPNLILTTGGTGLAPRDVTPEATAAVLERPTPGITELLLRESLAAQPLAALSRAVAGVRGGTLVVNLPGRPRAVRENLGILMPMLSHTLLALEGAR